jgi:RNA-directed DNA polymerase
LTCSREGRAQEGVIRLARDWQRVADKRILKLIRGFLTAGVLTDGLVSAMEEGTPQDGP